MAFQLYITDGVETANFIAATEYQVMDGGFDIGQPGSSKKYSQFRSGFYEPSRVDYEVREARLVFRPIGSTRQVIITNLAKIERILRSAEARSRLLAGKRAELVYQWDGSTNVTYFEILGGELVLPEDVLSVEKMFPKKTDGDYFIPGVELMLDLSPFGFNQSLTAAPTDELALSNPNQGSPITGGILVANAYDSQANYVEIAASEVLSGQPLITRVQINARNATSAYSRMKSLFIGHRVTPFPTGTLVEGESYAGFTGISPSVTANAAASGNNYATFSRTTTADPAFSDIFPVLHYTINPENTYGLFFAFLQAFDANLNEGTHYAIGVYDYVQNGYRYISDWVSPRTTTNTKSIPIGMVQIPPDPLIRTLGTAYTTFLGFFHGQDSNLSGIVTQVDLIDLLPMDNGLRVWIDRGTSALVDQEGDWKDCDWLGTQHLVRQDNSQITTPFIGLLNPIRLEPNVAQRLYFKSIGVSTGSTEGARSFRVRVYAVPAFKTMAL